MKKTKKKKINASKGMTDEGGGALCLCRLGGGHQGPRRGIGGGVVGLWFGGGGVWVFGGGKGGGEWKNEKGGPFSLPFQALLWCRYKRWLLWRYRESLWKSRKEGCLVRRNVTSRKNYDRRAVETKSGDRKREGKEVGGSRVSKKAAIWGQIVKKGGSSPGIGPISKEDL